ncbi:aldo/keto reductase [Colletotrichum scovillei]|uniref:Aldo/keto reductase n=1 Tax=Colletotrichum scovillei TaxID=1209932 RepID=A0A9P7R772_9PEZI|nr:aldo/keto reductase [Colletotrichum scovillei]KAG7068788.1 aldo/keto reductase [Colletotrichum scovillei]KAG7072746.1 aldo/keto reductase [Colletotrichum scovillei]
MGKLSISAQTSFKSSSLSSTSTQFCTTRSAFVDPGIGMAPCRRTQAMATCATVTPLRSAIFSTASTSLKFWTNASDLKRGNIRRMSLAGRSSGLRNSPVRRPRLTGL